MMTMAIINSVDYYTNLARVEGYYQSLLEPAGMWGAQGAAVLGLKGEVTSEALGALLAGRTPDGKRQVQNAGKANRQPGWDLTFSADKSVSVLWSQAEPGLRKEIETIHADAVKAAIAYLESVAIWTRRGRGGQHLEQASIAVAAFEHGSSRAGDPLLHTHVLLPNICVRSDGTIGTLVSKPIYMQKMVAGSLYRAELAALLGQRLGVRIERHGSLFHLPDVPQALCRAFSKRRIQIEQEIKRRGIVSAAGAAAATLATRTSKKQLSRAELRIQWQDTGRQFGFTEQQASTLIGRAHNRQSVDLNMLLEDSVSRLMQGESWFPARRLLRTVAEAAPGTGLTARDLCDGLDKFLANDPEIACVGEDRYTTSSMFQVENDLLQTAERLNNSKTVGLSASIVAQAAEFVEQEAKNQNGKSVTLNPEQRAALEHVTQKSGNLSLVSGMAGTGKTFFLSAARVAWEAGGYKVFGAALAGKAAQGLEEGAGITSSTLTRLLMDLNPPDWWQTVGHHLWQLTRAARGKQTWGLPDRIKIDRHTVLVIDEVGMVGTSVLAAVIKAVEKAGAKLVLVGDSSQLQAIEAGGAFAALEKRLGAKQLTHIVRQKDEWARQAVTMFAAGQTAAALQEYAKRGLLHIAPSRPEAAARLIADWKAYGVARPQDCLIFTGSRQERDLLNRQAQEARRAVGAIGWLPFAINGTRFYLGDRVMFTQNSKIYGVQNGMIGTLLSVDPIHNVARIRLDATSGRVGKSVSIPLSKYKALELAYAVTTHRGQGVTVDRAYVLSGGPMQDRELTYVQMSRARQETNLYADGASVGPELSDLVRAMATSRQKTMALDVVSETTSPHPVTSVAKVTPVPEPVPVPPIALYSRELPIPVETKMIHVELENLALKTAPSEPMPTLSPPSMSPPPTSLPPSTPIMPKMRP